MSIWNISARRLYLKFYWDIRTIALLVISSTFMLIFLAKEIQKFEKDTDKVNGRICPHGETSVESATKKSEQTIGNCDQLWRKQRKNSFQEKLKKAEEIYQKSVQARHKYVMEKGGPSKVEPWSLKNAIVYYWDYFTPAFNCPHLLQRVGRIGDGGKWVCGMELFERLKIHNAVPHFANKKCILYSFGVANESTFEAEFLRRTDCEIYTFDFTVNKLGPDITQSEIGDGKRVHFRKIGLGYNSLNTSFETLGEIMRQNGHKWIDVLKVDIEGGEFASLDQIMEEFPDILPFGQLQVEIHVDNFGRGFNSVYKWWQKLESKGLRAFMNEVNHNSCVANKMNPVAVEYSFLNVKGKHLIIQEED